MFLLRRSEVGEEEIQHNGAENGPQASSEKKKLRDKLNVISINHRLQKNILEMSILTRGQRREKVLWYITVTL